jgi:hypothetical protein
VVMVSAVVATELTSEMLAMAPPQSLTSSTRTCRVRTDDIDYKLVEHDGPTGKTTTLHQRSSAHYNSLVVAPAHATVRP